MLLTLPFPSNRQTQRRTETDIRTNRRKPRHTDRRALGEKQRQDAEDNRRESRDNTGDKDGGAAWCTYTATRAAVGGCEVIVLCCCVVGVVCLCLSCWDLLSGGRLPSPPLRWRFAISPLEVAAILLLRWPRHQGARDTTMRPRHQGCPRDPWQALGKMEQDLCVQFKSLLQLKLPFSSRTLLQIMYKKILSAFEQKLNEKEVCIFSWFTYLMSFSIFFAHKLDGHWGWCQRWNHAQRIYPKGRCHGGPTILPPPIGLQVTL